MRILVVMNASEVRLGGGIINVIINIKKGFLNKKEFSFDYAINEQTGSGIHEILQDSDSRFYQLPNKKKHFLTYVKRLYRICKSGKYDAVHIHGSSNTMAVELLCAYFAKIKKRIVHSHNSQCSHPIISKLLSPVMLLRTDALACSKVAGDWLFGENNFDILTNGIDTDKYKYNAESRKRYRDSFDINEDITAFVCIGNLVEQKNQEFLLPIMNELDEKKHLFIIGAGENREKLEQSIKNMRLSNKITMFSYRNDIPECLQAFDCLLMPSKWEGLPVVLVEAQTAGLPCIVSNYVSDEAMIVPHLFKKVGLNQDDWIENMKALQKNPDRTASFKEVIKKGYDVKDCVENLRGIYEN